MDIVITVEGITGHCPVYRKGDRIVLDDGYRLDPGETSGCCMHSLAALMPFYNALAKGVSPEELGLGHKDEGEGDKAWIQCPDPCEETDGGTALFSVTRVE